MPQVLYRLQRRPGESAVEFKVRCGESLMHTEVPEDAICVGRRAETSPGVLDQRTCHLWGRVHLELPADVCYLIALTLAEVKLPELRVSTAELRLAPEFVGPAVPPCRPNVAKIVRDGAAA